MSTVEEKLSPAQESERRLKFARRWYPEKTTPKQSARSVGYFLEVSIARAEAWLELEPEGTRPELRLLIHELKSQHRRIIRLERELEVDEGHSLPSKEAEQISRALSKPADETPCP